jgi:transposase
VDEVRWPTVLKNQPCCILTVKGQYFHKGGKRQQTTPAYLIVTGDYDIKDIEEILEVYLLRWEIEVGFRDQKNGLGIGKAQVWNENSVMKVPGFMSACYSMLMMASMRAFGDERGEQFAHLPRWRSKTPNRPSLRDLIELLRREVKSTIHKAA